MKISLITTIFNEEKSIKEFLAGLSGLSLMPDEVIIVDGGSTDQTLAKIAEFRDDTKLPFDFIIATKKGNRSVGRNEGVRIAKGEIIAFTDAGCILDKDWLKEITKPFADRSVDVAAGYYAARAETIFQKCLVPYVLVMPDKVNPDSFLPATRSMAIRKSVFEKMGGFDPKYSHNEDYVFARKLRFEGRTIVFAPKAIVNWIPRRTLKEAYTMFWRFAYGDIEAGILRPKVLLIFTRYVLGIILVITFLLTLNFYILIMLILGLVGYAIWAVQKNYLYVKNRQAIYVLPLIQFTADAAVLMGSTQGVIKRYGI